MASIHLLGGKKQFVTIQVSEFVALHHLFQCVRVLRRHARASFSWVAAALTSLALLIYLFTQLHGRLNGQTPPGRAGMADSSAGWEGGGAGAAAERREERGFIDIHV